MSRDAKEKIRIGQIGITVVLKDDDGWKDVIMQTKPDVVLPASILLLRLKRE